MTGLLTTFCDWPYLHQSRYGDYLSRRSSRDLQVLSALNPKLPPLVGFSVRLGQGALLLHARIDVRLCCGRSCVQRISIAGSAAVYSLVPRLLQTVLGRRIDSACTFVHLQLTSLNSVSGHLVQPTRCR